MKKHFKSIQSADHQVSVKIKITRVLWITAGILACVAVWLRITHTTTVHQGDLKQFADNVYATCSTQPYPPSCYDKEIPKLMDKGITMEQAFDVTRRIQEKDPRYLYCHVLGHNVSYKETSKDISKWKDVVTRCPTTFCNNGCQHGALMRRFNAESLTEAQIAQALPDLTDVCEPRGSWNPAEVERSMCYHGLGHLLMYITRADIPRSLDLCRSVGVKPDGRSYYITCSQGVFMTVYQPLEPEDFALIRNIQPTRDGVAAFCARYSGDDYLSCRSESWALFVSEIQKPEGLHEFCSYAPDIRGRNTCLSTAMNFLTTILVIDKQSRIDDLTTFCKKLPGDESGQCYADAAFRLVQIDPRYTELSISICAQATRDGSGDTCFPYLLSHVIHSFHRKSPESRAFCGKFPSPWDARCLHADDTGAEYVVTE